MGRIEKAVNHNTPTVMAHEGRGLVVRKIAFYRHPDQLDESQVRITRHHFTASGFLKQSADPRLANAGIANFIYHYDLRGDALHTRSVDAGTSVKLSDTAGRPLLIVNGILSTGDSTEDHSQAVSHTWHYEVPILPGRPLAVSEQVASEVPRTTQRFIYAASTAADKDRNIAGHCISHYDTAGLMTTECMALSGVPLSMTRRLPQAATDPDLQVDWHGADPTAWNALLGPERYTTVTCTDATGNVLITRDAADHQQRVAYGVNGQLARTWLTVKNSAEQPVVTALAHSAEGRKLSETHGNGVTCTYQYEPRTQRLAIIRVERQTGLLQDLRYQYDPVGNVLNARDESQPTRIWRNQRVGPESLYGYDSLYQLVSANGREMANAGRQNSHSTPASVPLASDNATYTRYIRHYHYDTAGNLTQIRHSAPASNNGYTTDITVSNRSNRGVTSTLAGTPEGVDALFTAAGHQRQLQPGQALEWTPRGELQKVTPVVRDGAPGDHELYRYDARCQRVLKSSTQQLNSQQVIYLANLELRTTGKENLQVLCVGEVGHAQVRVLHWVAGKPAEIANDQWRYQYGDLIGSHGLELDGNGNLISREEYYPYGETSVWAARSAVEADYKTVRFSGKERDATGLYYYGYRYYQPWAGRWLSADPAGTLDHLNLYCMVRNNPVSYLDDQGLMLQSPQADPSETREDIKILKYGLDNFESSEKDLVEATLETSLNTLISVTDPAFIPDATLMRHYFGSEYLSQYTNIRNSWNQTLDVLAEYPSTFSEYSQIYRAQTNTPNVFAATEQSNGTGRLYIFDNFFTLSHSPEALVATIIHEFSHFGYVNGMSAKVPNTHDFFYLSDGEPTFDSFKLLNRPKFQASDVITPELFLAETANFRSLHIVDANKNTLTYRQHNVDAYLTLNNAVTFFNNTPLLRSRIAARNADSIAYAAVKLAVKM
ncbi:RHS repeat-associated core domain-containing protein [Pseudomonas sp. HS6-2]|uniref:RHS repeat-associated core domain-containing protein n=1 Tax=Pseudomonas sp. HS6-2 TaxID=3410986 RepID=UPI003BC44C92